MTTSVLPSPAAAPTSPDAAAKPAKVTYLDLPCPIPYEEVHREALMCLKPELIDGMRMDLTKFFNEKFCVSHSMMAGYTVIPSQSSKIIKTPTISYDFGANYTDSKSMLLGKMTMDGRLSAEFKYDFTHNLALKANAQLTDEPHKSHGLINFDYKGSNYRTQFQMGSGALLGASYIQSVTPHLSFGSEVFWAGRKSGFGYAARYNTDKMVATGQFCSSGMLALSCVHKPSKRACLALNLIYNYMSNDITTSFGCCYNIPDSERNDHNIPLTQLKGKIDSNGVVAVSLEHFGVVIYSFEFDHFKRDYKLGFGLKLSDDNPLLCKGPKSFSNRTAKPILQ